MEQKEVWLENLQKLIANSGLSHKKIAEKALVSEQTVARLATAKDTDAKNTGLHTFISIVHACGGSVFDTIEGSGAQIVGVDYMNLRSQVDSLTAELNLALSELAVLRNTNAAQSAELDLLRLKLDHKEELIAHKDKIILLYSQQEKLWNATNH